MIKRRVFNGCKDRPFIWIVQALSSTAAAGVYFLTVDFRKERQI